MSSAGTQLSHVHAYDSWRKLEIMIYKVFKMDIVLTQTHQFTFYDGWMHFIGL